MECDKRKDMNSNKIISITSISPFLILRIYYNLNSMSRVNPYQEVDQDAGFILEFLVLKMINLEYLYLKEKYDRR